MFKRQNYLLMGIIGLAIWQGPSFAASEKLGDTLAEELVIASDIDRSEVIDSLEMQSQLRDVLRYTYLNNPTLRAARAELRAVHEELPQALSGYRPNITADADITDIFNESEGNTVITQDGGHTSKQFGMNIEQPLFRGGRTVADIRGAKNTIQAQRSILNALEQQILLDAVIAYIDVFRDKALLKLSEKNRDVIARQLEASEDRFSVGDATRTDVSQSRARLAGAEADIISARGDLQASIAIYEQVTGQKISEDICYPDLVLNLPDNISDAIAGAEKHNPNVIAAKYINAASEDGVDSVFGELLPEINLFGGLSRTVDPQPGFLNRQDSRTFGVSASVPLYQSGNIRSRIRQAKQTANQRFIEILEETRLARQQTIANWEALKAAEAEIISREAQVNASAIAQEGVREEADFGERTILDALDADQEYLDAQVALVTSRRDLAAARFALAQTMGMLHPANLGFGTDIYNHDKHLRKVSRTILGINIDIDEDRP